MARSRSRSRSSSTSRSRRGSSSSSSEDSEERDERIARKKERRERREAARLARKIRAEEKAKEAAADILAGKLSWTIMDTINTYEKDDDDDEEDDEDSQNIVHLLGRKPSGATASVVDCTDWSRMQTYLRETFEVHASNKKLGVKLKLLVKGKTELSGRSIDESTMSNWWSKVVASLMVQPAGLLPAQCGVIAELFAPKAAIKIKRKKKAESERSKVQKALFNSLVTAVYGESPGHFADGQWTAEASEIVRRNPSLLSKFLGMQRLTEKVMGSADYMPNPCVIICPFGGANCAHGRFRMNGACKPSQLYSHWGTVHKDNPAAKELDYRWRQAIKDKSLSLPQLDVCAPVNMERTDEEGGEPLRAAPSSGADLWPHNFTLDSTEHEDWLKATDEV